MSPAMLGYPDYGEVRPFGRREVAVIPNNYQSKRYSSRSKRYWDHILRRHEDGEDADDEHGDGDDHEDGEEHSGDEDDHEDGDDDHDDEEANPLLAAEGEEEGEGEEEDEEEEEEEEDSSDSEGDGVDAEDSSSSSDSSDSEEETSTTIAVPILTNQPLFTLTAIAPSLLQPPVVTSTPAAAPAITETSIASALPTIPNGANNNLAALLPSMMTFTNVGPPLADLMSIPATAPAVSAPSSTLPSDSGAGAGGVTTQATNTSQSLGLVAGVTGSFAVVFTGIWYFRKRRNARIAAAQLEKAEIRSVSTPPLGSEAGNISGPLSMTSENIVGGGFPREMRTDYMKNLEDQIRVAYVTDQVANGNNAQAYERSSQAYWGTSRDYGVNDQGYGGNAQGYGEYGAYQGSRSEGGDARFENPAGRSVYVEEDQWPRPSGAGTRNGNGDGRPVWSL